MLPALAAATAAIDALQALTAAKKKNAATSGAAQPTPNPFAVPAATTASTAATPVIASSAQSSGTLSSGTMSAMLDAQSQSSASVSTKRSDALKSLFGQLDSDASGGISKAEFGDKLGAGGTNVAAADNVFGKLDTDGDGSVSLKELAAALSKPKKEKADDVDKSASADPLLTALQDASAATAADGTAATALSSTLAATSASATSSYNSIEQMIQRQAQAISASTTANSSLSINA